MKFIYPVRKDGNVLYEIYVESYSKFYVYYPEYNWDIKTGTGLTVEYGRDQILCMLFAYDKKECMEFMQELYKIEGLPVKYLERVPAFKKIMEENHGRTIKENQ